MTETVLVALIANVMTLLVAIGGWVLTYKLQCDARRQARLERQVEKLGQEVRARIALEKAACEWLGEVTQRTAESAKRELRRRAQERSGLRPKLSDSDLNGLPID